MIRNLILGGLLSALFVTAALVSFFWTPFEYTALNIPARYVCGYLPDIAVENPPDVPMDFHAWFEVYLGGGWRTFDARHNEPRVGRALIAYGRDAVDAAFATTYGATRLETMRVWADEVNDTPTLGEPPND
mgnify:CR=1 FL=1